MVAVPVAVISAVGGFLISQYLNRRCCKKGLVNTCISKDSPKVVHSFDMEDIGSKAVYCRCWKSKKVRPSSHFCSSAECLDNWNTCIGKKKKLHYRLYTQSDFCNSNIRAVLLSTKGKFDKSNCVFASNVVQLWLQFPYCDGSHSKHNDETGDNVGPLIIKKKDA